jgi:hypothetical protein
MSDDHLLSLLDERIAELTAVVPQDLTKIAVGRPTLGLESLVSASMEGDPAGQKDANLATYPGPVGSTIDGGIPDNTAAAAPWSADTVRIYLNEVIDGEISADTIAVDVDKVTRTVSLAAVSADLALIGVAVGAAVTAINGWVSYEFLERGLPVDEIFYCDIALGKRTIRLALIFKDEAIEQGPICGEAANETDAEDWKRFTAPAAADVDGRPVFANLSELPAWDRRPECVRPPRPTATSWDPFREGPAPKEWWQS